jgi:N utilization substance protein B
MGFIEKAIIRVMGFEILKEKSVPELVIINEAIEIAKKYGNDYSHKFVNGILDEIRKKFTTTEKN